MKKKKLLSLEEEVIKRMKEISSEKGMSYSDLVSNLILTYEKGLVYDKELFAALRRLQPHLTTDSMAINAAGHNLLAFLSRFPTAKAIPPQAPLPTISDATPLNVDIGITPNEDVLYEPELQ